MYKDMPYISLYSIRQFYVKKLGLSYKRISVRDPKIRINNAAISNQMQFILDHLMKGYWLISADETSFGRYDFVKYGWSKKGKPAENNFNSLKSISMVCCISHQGIICYKFYNGGLRNPVFEEFLQGIY